MMRQVRRPYPTCSPVVVLFVVFGLLLVFPRPIRADRFAEIQQRGRLRWGADAEGGGPYVYPRDDDPTQYQGFEVELADWLASHLSVKGAFQQSPWDQLPQLLDRGDVDIVLNGYEWKPLWAERFGTSIPYYVYELQMLCRKSDPRLQQLDDLRRLPTSGRKWKIGVLGGSAAQAYLDEEFPDTVEPMIFEGNAIAMRGVELALDGLDATLQDLPIVIFYEQRYPLLRRLGAPQQPGYYVILTRKEDQALLRAINHALLQGLQDGSIANILQRYGLWNETQSRRGLLLGIDGGFQPNPAPPRSTADENSVATNSSPISVPGQAFRGRATDGQGWLLRIPRLLQGAVVTVFLSICAMPLAMLVGLGIALGRMMGPRWLRLVLSGYVELIRGTPLVLQLFVIFFLFPEVGISFPPLVAAVLGLAMNYSAYESEIYRAGLAAVPPGQMEAALALGMEPSLAMRRIIVPQAVRIVIPPVMNDFIALFKDTAVCSVITVVELSKQYYIQSQSTGGVIQLGIATSLCYLAMSYPLTFFSNHVERRLARGRRP